MANSLLTINGPTADQERATMDQEAKPSKDTRCWGYHTADNEQGWEGKIFSSPEERKKAGYVDTPADVKEKAAAAPKGKPKPAPDVEE